MAEKVADMTLGDALEFLRSDPWACACCGGEWCCARVAAQSRALQRGAHILIKMIAEKGK